MSIDYSKLASGQSVSNETYILDAGMVSRYVEAVGDGSWAGLGVGDRRMAPPMAVAALSLRGVLTDLQIPGGTLHAGQELEFRAPVAVGETLECRAVLTQNSVRGDWRFMVVQLEVENGEGVSVMAGKSTIMLPA